MARYDFIAVYLMASRRNGTLYLGVTSDLLQRGLEHREGRCAGYSAKYGCTLLVWWEQQDDMASAIAREKDIKDWRRAWKLALIEKPIRNGATSTKTCCCRNICAATTIRGMSVRQGRDRPRRGRPGPILRLD